MNWKCRFLGHRYIYSSLNKINWRCDRCGWFDFGPNPNFHTVKRDNRECRSGKEFSQIMWQRIKPYGWSWKRDVRPWLASVFDGTKFGDPRFDWSTEAARALADEFLREATTW